MSDDEMVTNEIRSSCDKQEDPKAYIHMYVVKITL